MEHLKPKLFTGTRTHNYYIPVLVPYFHHQLHVALGESRALVSRNVAGTVEKKLRHRWASKQQIKTQQVNADQVTATSQTLSQATYCFTAASCML